jgi:thioredoxin-like negative regulator of GroEL
MNPMPEDTGDAPERDEALRLRRLVSLSPQDPELRLQLARRLLDACRIEEALSELRVVIRQDPNNLAARKLREQAQRQRFGRLAER